MYGQRRTTRRLCLLRRLRVHFGSVYRVCDNYWLMLDNRLRRWQRVYGRGSAARSVYV